MPVIDQSPDWRRVVFALHRSYHFFKMSTFITRLCVLLVLLSLATGCDDSESPDSESPRTDQPSTGCSIEEELRADQSARRGGMRGDVTGDGASDEIFIAVDEGAEVGCRALLF